MNKKLYNLLLLSAALLFASSCNNNSEEPAPIPEPPMICPSDSLVMVDFYHSMKGDEWERPWDLTNPKTWHGITGMWNEEKQYYELYETTMNPANRHLVQLTTEDMEATMQLYHDLMGKQPSLRREFIMNNKLSSVKGDDDLYEDGDFIDE